MSNCSTDCKPIAGIKCEVTNCVYHKGDNLCEAGCIEVNCKGHACDCSDTACATFRAKEGL